MEYLADPPRSAELVIVIGGGVERLHGWGQTDVEVLSGDETRERFPYVGANVIQARYRAGDGFLDTKQLTFGLAHASGAAHPLDSPLCFAGRSRPR